MSGIRWLSSCFKPNLGPRASNAGTNRVESQPAKPPSQAGLPPSGPGLQRTKSNPDRLPSNTPERTHVEPARPPITRAEPDTTPPKHYGRRSAFLGIPLPFKTSTKLGSMQKISDLERTGFTLQDVDTEVRRNPELMKMIKERHPNFDLYNAKWKRKAFEVIQEHPAYRKLVRKLVNELSHVPSVATATRKMTPSEQKFLTNAFQQVSEEIRKNPFHLHGETAITGTKDGKITQFDYNAGLTCGTWPGKDDKFHLHTHPPFMEPSTSSASDMDHIAAARHYYYNDNRPLTYVTNGKDVLHIQPDSTELVKLIPDPEIEKKLGTFPVAFKVPDPELPPHPFSNHEAPATFKKWDRER